MRLCLNIRDEGTDYCLDCKWLRKSLKTMDKKYYDCGLPGHFTRDQSGFQLRDQKKKLLLAGTKELHERKMEKHPDMEEDKRR